MNRKMQAGKSTKGSAQKKVDWKTLEIVHPDAAGIDVGGSEHWVAISPDRDPEPVRRFGCFTVDLREMARWLIDKGVRSVALQSTGVYWMPVLEVLEQHGIEVFLVNAQHTKNVPGRKSDVQECQWLLKLHAFGLLNNSFQPNDEIRVARSLWRHRGDLVAEAGSAVQRMQKALTEMNVQLSNVLSDLSGVSGMNIVQAILEGERDPQALAALVMPGVKATPEDIAKSLEGNWREEPLFVLRQHLGANARSSLEAAFQGTPAALHGSPRSCDDFPLRRNECEMLLRAIDVRNRDQLASPRARIEERTVICL